jgi:hypothetical protein
VEESLKISGITNLTKSIPFWIPQEAENILFILNNEEIICFTEGNNYICNISSYSGSYEDPMTIVIEYSLEKDEKEYTKTLTYNTSSLSVIFNNNNIYQGENLQNSNTFTLMLYEPSETPLSGYMIIFIVLLVILLIVSSVYSYRRQRTWRSQENTHESEEYLQAKKNLLTSLLKDIEKQHRGKKISDDTYHKLKDSYKQQAVDAMKKLEDIGSK